MLDSRYLIVSLAAVFTALGIGIVMGFALGGAGILDTTEKALVARLEEDLGRLLREGRQQRLTLEQREQELVALRAAQSHLTAAAVAGRLSGLPVAVVQTGPGPLPEGLEAVLLQAGARVTAAVALGDPSPAAVQWPDALGAAVDPVTLLAGYLGRGLADPLAGDGLGRLAQWGLVQVSAQPDEAPVAVVLVAGGATGPPWDMRVSDSLRRLDLPLAAILTERGVAVVGTFRGDGGAYGPAYRSALPAVAAAETAPGQVDLIHRLAALLKGG